MTQTTNFDDKRNEDSFEIPDFSASIFSLDHYDNPYVILVNQYLGSIEVESQEDGCTYFEYKILPDLIIDGFQDVFDYDMAIQQIKDFFDAFHHIARIKINFYENDDSSIANVAAPLISSYQFFEDDDISGTKIDKIEIFQPSSINLKYRLLLSDSETIESAIIHETTHILTFNSPCSVLISEGLAHCSESLYASLNSRNYTDAMGLSDTTILNYSGHFNFGDSPIIDNPNMETFLRSLGADVIFYSLGESNDSRVANFRKLIQILQKSIPEYGKEIIAPKLEPWLEKLQEEMPDFVKRIKKHPLFHSPNYGIANARTTVWFGEGMPMKDRANWGTLYDFDFEYNSKYGTSGVTHMTDAGFLKFDQFDLNPGTMTPRTSEIRFALANGVHVETKVRSENCSVYIGYSFVFSSLKVGGYLNEPSDIDTLGLDKGFDIEVKNYRDQWQKIGGGKKFKLSKVELEDVKSVLKN